MRDMPETIWARRALSEHRFGTWEQRRYVHDPSTEYIRAPEWRPLPGPTLERVMIAGWQARNGFTAGYWWYHEGVTDENGMPIDDPDARLWAPLVIPPFPKSPDDVKGVRDE